MRDSVVLYRSFYEAVKDLPRDIQAEVLMAALEYGLNAVEVEGLKPIARSIFTLIKPIIDSNNKKFENGKKGGRPKNQTETISNQTETKIKPNNNQNETKAQPNEDVDVDIEYKENTTKVVQKKVGSADPPTRKKKSKEEIELELKERMNDFYESLAPFVEVYGKEMIRQFYDYWIEPNKSKTKMRFETQATWDLKLRLSRWSANDKSFTHGSYTQNNSKNYNIDTAPKNYHERM